MGDVPTVHVLLLPVGVDGALSDLAVIRRELVRCDAGRFSMNAIDLVKRSVGLSPARGGKAIPKARAIDGLTRWSRMNNRL